MIRIFGDIHGDIRGMRANQPTGHKSVQIGDFGFGFTSVGDERYRKFLMDNPGNFFIRGNHDNPAECRKNYSFIEDGEIIDDVLYIGGAWSIDWKYREEGISWWADEEVSEEKFTEIFEKVKTERPSYMITHEGPNPATQKMFIDKNLGMFGVGLIENTTNKWLTRILEEAPPKVWFYGHWHVTSIDKIGDTTFVCVGEQDYVDFDEKTGEIFFRDYQNMRHANG